MNRFHKAITRIDAANAEDPGHIEAGGVMRPSELVYGERMSAALERLYPDASEPLKLAARAQHIRRWTVPRSGYPMDRSGYHRWRNELKRKHGEWAGEILASCGYSADEIARVAALIRKEGLKSDPEAQALEDTACLVFLENYCEAFAEKHEEDKLLLIFARTWSKMSDHGRAMARASTLPARVRHLLETALAQSHSGQTPQTHMTRCDPSTARGS